LEESKRCMTICIPGSISTLTMGRIFKVEAEEWGRVRITGYICARIWESVHPVFSSTQFPH
jgi:hypothetical protein